MTTTTIILLIILVFIIVGNIFLYYLLKNIYKVQLHSAIGVVEELQHKLDAEREEVDFLRKKIIYITRERGEPRRHYSMEDMTPDQWEKMSEDERAAVKWRLAKIIAKRIVKWHEPVLTQYRGADVIMYNFWITERNVGEGTKVD